jgi:hypothetical protein
MKNKLVVTSELSFDELEIAFDVLSEDLKPEQFRTFARNTIDNLIYRVAQVSSEKDIEKLAKHIVKVSGNFYE